MGKRTLTTRVPDSVADDWDEYVDENPDDVNSMAHLLRKAVNAYVADSGESEPTTTTEQPTASGDVLNALERIEARLDELDDKVGSVERATYGNAGEWLEDIYEALPEGERNAVHPSVVSKVSGAPTAVVIETVNKMKDDMDVAISDDGYYKEES